MIPCQARANDRTTFTLYSLGVFKSTSAYPGENGLAQPPSGLPSGVVLELTNVIGFGGISLDLARCSSPPLGDEPLLWPSYGASVLLFESDLNEMYSSSFFPYGTFPLKSAHIRRICRRDSRVVPKTTSIKYPVEALAR